MNGGEISDNSTTVYSSIDSYGGGVYISSGSFTMSGGTISDNSANFSANSYGGGVYVSGGSFTMSNGTISDNSAISFTANSYGGGVCVSGGSFTMSGGTISGNSATSSSSFSSCGGGGVYVGTNGVFNKTDGTITDTNFLEPYTNTRGRVAYVVNGPRHRETEAGPEVNLTSANAENWE
jgi:hypothetical protein